MPRSANSPAEPVHTPHGRVLRGSVWLCDADKVRTTLLFASCSGIVALLLGCDRGGVDLILVVRTDLVPSVEFAAIAAAVDDVLRLYVCFAGSSDGAHFRGAFGQRITLGADCTPACASHPETGGCECPDDTSTFSLGDFDGFGANDCRGRFSYCLGAGSPTTFYGAYSRSLSTCLTPNPVTGDCECPGRSTETVFRATPDVVFCHAP